MTASDCDSSDVTLLQSILLNAEGAEVSVVKRAVVRIRTRLIELEAPSDTVAAWDAYTVTR